MNRSFNDDFAKIKEIIIQLEPQSTADLIIARLYEVSDDPDFQLTRQTTPWDLLLLLKWTLALPRERGMRMCTPDDVRILCAMISGSNGTSASVIMGADQNKIRKFLRLISFQQFWLQRDYRRISAEMGRNYKLFFAMNEGLNVRAEFKRIFGIEIRDFLTLNVFVWSKLAIEQQFYFDRSWFSITSLDQKLGKETIEKYLCLISMDFFELIEFCKNSFAKSSPYLQSCEQTPLRNKPFLRVDERYFSYYPAIFANFVEESPYDLMKSAGSQAFSTGFGKRMESYIGESVRANGISFVPEAALKDLFGENEETVDFILRFEHFNIYVESKAVEMSGKGKIDPNPRIFKHSTRDSAHKAVTQCLYVSEQVKKGRVPDVQAKESFFFIVTYKELYLGDGSAVWEELFRDLTEKYCVANQIDIRQVDPSKMFFVPLSEFERFLHFIGTNPESVVREKLLNIHASTIDPATQMYLFSQHFGEFDAERDRSEILTKSTDDFFRHVLSLTQGPQVI